MKYFRWFVCCLLISLGALVLGLLVDATPEWLWIPVVIGPLLVYHLWFLRTNLSRIDDIAVVDSIYYYGFLITVTSLALTAASIPASGDVDVHAVLVKFGVGLVATGYAVFARIHLLSQMAAEHKSPDDALAEALRRSTILVDDTQAASENMRQFSETVIRESQQLHVWSKERFERSLSETTEQFNRELNQALVSTREAISELRSVIADATFAAERVELNKLVGETIAIARQLSRTMKTFNDRFAAGADGVAQFNEAVGATSSGVHLAAERFEAFVGNNGPLKKATDNAIVSTEATALVAAGAREALESINSFVRDLREQGAVTDSIAAFSGSARQHMETVNAASNELAIALAALSDAANRAKGTTVAIVETAGLLPEAARVAGGAAGSFGQLQQAMSGSVQELERAARQSVEASTMLANALASVARSIVDSTRARQGAVS